MRTWWIGDFCGALVVVPARARLLPLPSRLPPRSRIIEGALLLATVAVLGEVTAHSTDPVAYLVFPH